MEVGNIREILKDLTLIIPTFNRKANLHKALKFYLRFDLKVIVLDGTVQRSLNENFANVTYVHMPESAFHIRLLKSTDFIETRYVALVADDDFHLVTGLSKCVEFLNQNLEYSAAQGLFIRFSNGNFFSWRPDYELTNFNRLNSDSPETRLLNAQQYPHFLYSIIREEAFKKVISVFQGIKLGCEDMNELAFKYVLPLTGKFKDLPQLYSARLSHEKVPVKIEFRDWANLRLSDEFQVYSQNIFDIYLKYFSNKKAKELFNQLTFSFCATKKSKPKSLKIRLIQIFRLNETKYFKFFRLISSADRIKWFFRQKSSVFKTFQEVRKLKNFLKNES